MAVFFYRYNLLKALETPMQKALLVLDLVTAFAFYLTKKVIRRLF